MSMVGYTAMTKTNTKKRKSNAGRPLLPEGKIRDKTVGIPVSAAHYEHLAAGAARASQSLAAYCRSFLPSAPM